MQEIDKKHYLQHLQYQRAKGSNCDFHTESLTRVEVPNIRGQNYFTLPEPLTL